MVFTGNKQLLMHGGGPGNEAIAIIECHYYRTKFLCIVKPL